MLVYIRKDGRVTIPKQIRERVSLRPQSWALAMIHLDSVTLTPLKEAPKIRLDKLKS